MHLLPDGAGYRAAYRDRADAGALPPFDVRFPMITVTADSVSLNDAAIERAIDNAVRESGGRGDLVLQVRAILKIARAEKTEWLDDLGRWWTSHLLSSETAIERLLDQRNELDNSFGRGAYADGRTRDAIAQIDARLALLGRSTVTAPAATTPAAGGPTHHGESTIIKACPDCGKDPRTCDCIPF